MIVALIWIPNICIKCFRVFGFIIKILATVGLMLSIFTFLTKIEIHPYLDTFENTAFAVSAAFVFGSHLAFTMAFDSTYVAPVIMGKLISGICAIVLVLVIYKEPPAAADAV